MHHRLDAWKKSTKQVPVHAPVDSVHTPYNYFQSTYVQNGRRDKEKMNNFSQPRLSNLAQQQGISEGRRYFSEEPEKGFKQQENENYVKYRNEYERVQRPKEKGLRDPFNRFLPRSDVEVMNDKRNDSSVFKNSKVTSSTSLATQIENHLASRKSKQGYKNDGTFSKSIEFTKQSEKNERNMTSFENSSKLKQINGFSYGIQKDQVSREKQ